MKTKFSRKVLALVLAFALVVPMFAMMVSAEDEGEWTLVTDASKLAAGDKVIIVAANEDYALSTESRNNNKGSVAIAKGSNTVTINDSVQVFTLEAGVSDGTFAFSTGSQYLYSTLNGSNYLKYQSTKNAAASWTISIAANGVATVKAGTGTTSSSYRNWMRFNTSNSPKLFSCYGSGQTDISIYKLQASTGAPSISISGSSDLMIGKNTTLDVVLSNLTGDVVWTSSNPEFATVDGGVVTGKAMGTTTITAAIGETTAEKEITVYPDNTDAITIAEALAIAEFAGDSYSPYAYTVIGTVDSIDTAWSEQYNNITVTIFDGTESLYLYRMTGGETLQVGQKIAVSGKLGTHSSNPQMQYGEYELVIDDSTQAVLDALNALEAKMSLAYQYKAETTMEEVEVTSDVVDTLNKALTGVGTSGYTDWSGKTSNSSAVYAGNSCGTTNDYIQLRSSGNNSGIVTTASGGKAVSITVAWNSSTTSGRTIDIYGSNTAYTAASELYNTSTQGTKIGSLAKGETTLNIENLGDYAYIGIRSASGALYLTSVEITWAASTGGTEEKEVTTYSDSEFVIRCGIEAGLVDLDVDSFGIRVSAGDKVVDYTTTASSWGNDGDFCYVTISLGDIINEVAKLGTEFTVVAVVTIDGVDYVSETVATYSVATMIDEYNGRDDVDVSDLYNYLVSKGLI